MSYLQHDQRVHSLSEAIEAFMLFARIARIEGRSPKTIEIYRVAFHDLSGFLGSQEISLAQLTPGDFRRWIDARLSESYSKVTINIRLRSLKAHCFSLLSSTRDIINEDEEGLCRLPCKKSWNTSMPIAMSG